MGKTRRNSSKKIRRNISKKYGGTGEEMAESQRLTIIPTKVSLTKTGKPTTFRKDFTKIPGENVITDINNAMIAEPSENMNELEVAAVTYKQPKDLATRSFRKLGKMTGFIPRNEKKPLTDADFDTSIFEGTCLENVVLTINEVAFFKNFSTLRGRNNENRIETLRNKAEGYCELRNRILDKDPEFIIKYPNLFSSMIIGHFYGEQMVLDMIPDILNFTPERLTQLNNRSLPSTMSNDLEFAVNRYAYNMGEGSQLLPKPVGGKKHRKHRTKKNKSIKNKSRKHKR